MFFAHSKGETKSDWQLLRDHLNRTAELAKKISEGTPFVDYVQLVGRLHDIGKYSLSFQERISGGKITVDHSTAGAQLVMKIAEGDINKKFIAKLLAYCIAGHHSGLPDYGASIDQVNAPTLLARLKRPVEDYSACFEEFPIETFDVPASLSIQPTKQDGQFSVSFFVRMVYSFLVDADFLETESFINGEKPRGNFHSIETIHNRFKEYLEKFETPVSSINKKRTQLLQTCLDQSALQQGLFSLTIPTGGGKTYTSLAFALTHAKNHGMKRIIYCIPFTSIIEQTADIFRKCLGGECVLEHHSNFDWQNFYKSTENVSTDDQTNIATEKLKLASENWDIPIIVTTNVQFFESLFSNRSSRCRKLHSLMNSVIIFDEAQMLPKEYLEPCMLGLGELIVNYGASVVFCTATQPPLSKFMPEIIQQKELIPSPGEVYKFFKRVDVSIIGHKKDEEITQSMEAYSQALCIVNTRKHAKGLFDRMSERGRFHLSTLMCPTHRKKIITEIRKRLEAGDICRVISTQIMEAGIDVDFPVGFRALAGLDSIVQAAGRVNRENRLDRGTLFVFEPDSRLIKHVPAYIKQTSDVAKIIIGEYEDPISIEALTAYYQLLYDIQGTDAFDKKDILGCFEKGILDEPVFDFKTASEKFKLIENDTVAVIIPWDEQARNNIKKLRFSNYIFSTVRSLQAYTVNIYPQEFAALYNASEIEILHDRFAILREMREEVYHPKTGLVIPDDATGEAIIF